MQLDFLANVFQEARRAEAIIWKDVAHTYEQLMNTIVASRALLDRNGIGSGTVVALEGDFSPRAIALLLALVERDALIVPLLRSQTEQALNGRLDTAQAEFLFVVDDDDSVSGQRRTVAADHPFYVQLRLRQHPGLVLFTSGSTGKPKAAVHDFSKLLIKFRVRRPSWRMLNFFLFDHWGGLNTLLHTLSNMGVVITVQDRSPEGVCRAIAQHRIEVLPASPTFLNLMLLSGAYRNHDLSSLRTISYGTEPMQTSTLRRLAEIFPHVKLQQTYGLIELGVMRSKSKSSNSLWVKLGGEGYSHRVVDGILQIKAESAMLGYLNAPSPFTEDGWFVTGDRVEVEGEYLRILGRESEQINVGGEKVFPAEVESVIQELDNIAEAMVYGEKNPIVGNMVCAKVRLHSPEDSRAIAARVKAHCIQRLASFKVPVRVMIVERIDHSERGKKLRG